MKWYVSTRSRLGLALACLSLASVMLFAAGAWRNHSLEFDYLIYNLFLAWIPLGLTVWLQKLLRTRLWSSWPPFLLTLFWLGFLPNTFYMVSDYIHLQEVGRVDLIYDVIMFSSFIFNAFILGLVSLFVVHGELRKRVSRASAWRLVAATIFLTSFAIYIGRDLRWNTWDVLLNPASILFDVSDRLLAPHQHPEMFTTTFGFAVLIGSMYGLTWFAAQAARQLKSLD
ncbi:MAG TPA: DUF1361 domain-containing protein [Candidatus Saccharimonadales bacterium]|nr:DUF1361 domain-containing protein [Candidatus Saccharimonadales bacterium]